MKKTKWIVALLLISTFSLTSCLKDEVDDLQDDVNKIQTALGTNEPLTMKFETKDGNNEDIIENTSYLFKAGGTSEYIGDYQDGWYEIYIERFSDVNWNEGAYIDFYYNATTKEVEIDDFGAYFYDKYGRWVTPYFYESDGTSTLSIEVKSFNATTGEIFVEVSGTTTAEYSSNEFSTKPMTISMSFAGKLPVYVWQGS